MRKRILCLLAALMLLVPAIPAAAQEMDTANLDYTFAGIDGGTISTASNGKIKVLVFFRVDCVNCQNVLRTIANSRWIQEEDLADVCAVSMAQKVENQQWVEATADDVRNFEATYCSAAKGRIQFGLDAQVNDVMIAYGEPAGLVTTIDNGYLIQKKIGTPVVAIVDSKNQLRHVTNSGTAVDGIEEKLNSIKAENPDNPNNPGDPSDPDTPENPGTPDDPSNPDTPDNPGTPDDPSKPDDTQKPEQPEQPEQPVTEESSNDQPACSHRVESVLMSGSTDTTDAVVASKCVKCGAVLGYEKVANSAYHTFLKETADAIANAKEATVVIDAKMWVSFDKSVFEAIKSRPDVAVTVNYSYEGQKYVLQIPAGVNVDLLMDENGFGGFRYIEKVLNTNK